VRLEVNGRRWKAEVGANRLNGKNIFSCITVWQIGCTASIDKTFDFVNDPQLA
jgi:hypothetical protein